MLKWNDPLDNRKFSRIFVMHGISKPNTILSSIFLFFHFIPASDPISVLVPTNSAFRALPSGVLDDLKREKSKLKNLLKYHVISGVRYSASLSSGQRIMASQGDEISVSTESGRSFDLIFEDGVHLL